MIYSKYKYKFYVNASHAIYLNGVLGESHPHTWEIVIDTLKVREDFVRFDALESDIEGFLARFQDADINTVEPFTSINPTLENLAEYLKTSLSEILLNNGWILGQLELSETPTRSYLIDLTDEADELRRGEDIVGLAAERRLAEMMSAPNLKSGADN